MLTIYGTLRSRTTRVIWAAEELGLPYHREKVVFAAAVADPLAADAPMNTASPAYLRINPMGQLPAIDDEGVRLGESAAICLYLARKAGGPVAAASLAEEAEILQWSFIAATAIEPAAIEILYTYMGGKSETPEGQGVITAALGKLARPLTRLDTHLKAHDGLVGDRFTIADIVMAETIRYVAVVPSAFADFPAIKAWLDRCHARPAFQKMWAMRDAE